MSRSRSLQEQLWPKHRSELLSPELGETGTAEKRASNIRKGPVLQSEELAEVVQDGMAKVAHGT